MSLSIIQLFDRIRGGRSWPSREKATEVTGGVGSVLTKDEIAKTQELSMGVYKARVVGSRMPRLYYDALQIANRK